MDEQYTPTEEQVRFAHVDRRCFLDGINRFDVKTDEEYGAEFDRWLAAHDARVRRDAAREALDGLAAELMEAARDCATDGDHGGAGAWRNASAHTYHYRDTHYPETEDQT